jgi:hypothetical protein
MPVCRGSDRVCYPDPLRPPSLDDSDSPQGVASQAQCLKALVPFSKLKGLVDEEDIQDVRDTRCDTCANCPTCRLSARAKTRSLQVSYKQEVIEKNVTINLDVKNVTVQLPFIRPPAEFLRRKHGRTDNLYQALEFTKLNAESLRK